MVNDKCWDSYSFRRRVEGYLVKVGYRFSLFCKVFKLTFNISNLHSPIKLTTSESVSAGLGHRRFLRQSWASFFCVEKPIWLSEKATKMYVFCGPAGLR